MVDAPAAVCMWRSGYEVGDEAADEPLDPVHDRVRPGL